MSLFTDITKAIKRTAAKVAGIPYGEQGFIRDWSYGKTPRPFVNDDVVNKKGSADYELMMHDPDVKGALLIKTAGVLANGWEIVPGVDKDDTNYAKAEEQCNFVKAVFEEMPGSLGDPLEDMLYGALGWGVTMAEKIWGIDKDSGFIVLSKLKPKDPRLYDFKTDDYGNITEIDVKIKGGYIPVDPAKFVRMSYNNNYDEPWGTPDLRAAYLPWKIKQQLIRFWAVYLEKFATPTMKGTYPTGTPKSEQDKILAALNSLQQETSFVIPDTTIVEMMETQGKTSSDFNTALDYYGKQIVKAILGQTLATEQGKTGSYAQAKVHQDTLKIYIMKLKRMIEETVNEQIIRDIIDYNFADRFYPNFTLCIDDKDIAAMTQAYYQMITAGELMPGESFIRESLGWPERPKVEAIPTQSMDTKPPKRTTQPTDTQNVDNTPNRKQDVQAD